MQSAEIDEFCVHGACALSLSGTGVFGIADVENILRAVGSSVLALFCTLLKNSACTCTAVLVLRIYLSAAAIVLQAGEQQH